MISEKNKEEQIVNIYGYYEMTEPYIVMIAEKGEDKERK